jgi:uncharacterized protein YerC
MATTAVEVSIVSIEQPEHLAEVLTDVCTFRQLRALAKRNGITQYSYLGKRGLAFCLAFQAQNKAKRYHHIVNL